MQQAMTVVNWIKQRFSRVGEISDTGATAFAFDSGFDENAEVTDNLKRSLFKAVDDFTEKNLFHPVSMSEGGVSMSYGSDTAKNYGLLMLRKYGVELNDETSALIGLSTIKDKSNHW